MSRKNDKNIAAVESTTAQVAAVEPTAVSAVVAARFDAALRLVADGVAALKAISVARHFGMHHRISSIERSVEGISKVAVRAAKAAGHVSRKDPEKAAARAAKSAAYAEHRKTVAERLAAKNAARKAKLEAQLAKLNGAVAEPIS